MHDQSNARRNPNIDDLLMNTSPQSGLESIPLADGGRLLVGERFLSQELADRYFAELRDHCVWEQKPGLFGRPQPRLTASYGDAGVTYRYSGTANVALPWTSTLLEIKERLEAVGVSSPQGLTPCEPHCERPTERSASPLSDGAICVAGSTDVLARYNYVLLNRYRDGCDSMGPHADDEPEMGPVVGSLSLGATRTFRIRHNTTKETRSFCLGHGTLVIMAGTMQQFWKHEIPKTRAPVGERINLTFRHINRE